MEKSIKMDKLTLGVCYYPEHWPESLWDDDLRRMKELGLEIIRIAEFAWNKFEPREGEYTFDFFDRFLECCEKHSMKVIFCTPTATPPAWLTEKYPEVLNAFKDGTLIRHGMRRHYNYNSAKYRDFTGKIVDRIASHYSPHPLVVGWQIDNELNCETNEFYSEADHTAFREYLKNKFLTLESLNDAMGTTFWNQTYSSWEEVYLSRANIHMANNPHLALEEKRFVSKSTISFLKLQADIIRQYLRSDQFITTNGLFGHLDSHEMTEENLDFITYDSYPNFAFNVGNDLKDGSINDRKWAWSLMKARSISPNFGIMEQQSGPGGWDIKMKQPSPKPGQMRLWTFQSIAHGADYISYFRWRTCWIGTEIYWHGLNDYSNLPNRRLDELKVIYEDVKKLSFLAGSRYQAKIAYIKDYDNEWDGEQDQWHGPLDSFSDDGWLAAAQLSHTPMDFLFISNGQTGKTKLQELEKYELLIYPHATILTSETAGLLKEYVIGGGTLIMGARTGYKDIFGRCPMQPLPGYAGDICGVRVTDFTNLGPGDDEEFALWDEDKLAAPIFNDILEARDGARVLARFEGNYYDGAPALIENSLGKGKAYYFGAGFSAQTAEIFLRKLGFAAPYINLLELPKEVELAIRKKDLSNYIILLNYKPYPVKVKIKKEMEELLLGKSLSGEVEIEKYGVLVLKYTD